MVGCCLCLRECMSRSGQRPASNNPRCCSADWPARAVISLCCQWPSVAVRPARNCRKKSTQSAPIRPLPALPLFPPIPHLPTKASKVRLRSGKAGATCSPLFTWQAAEKESHLRVLFLDSGATSFQHNLQRDIPGIQPLIFSFSALLFKSA